jgi:hypothetical protein
MFHQVKLGAPLFYKVKKGFGKVQAVVAIFAASFKQMALCVDDKQPMRAQVEAVYSLSILCDIYGRDGYFFAPNYPLI